MGGNDNRRTGRAGRAGGRGEPPPPPMTVALDQHGLLHGAEPPTDPGTRPYDPDEWTRPGSVTWLPPGSGTDSDPDVWTGSAPVPGQEAGGWTQQYEFEPEADAPRRRRAGRTPPLASGRRYRRAVVIAAGVVALVLLGVASVPVLRRLGFGLGTTPKPTATMPAAVAPAAPQTLTVEAESPDNTLSGSAFAGPYQDTSGGQLVRAIGVWGGNKGPGVLRFNNLTVPTTGRYAVTFYYVNIKGRATRTVIVTTGAGDSVNVTVTGHNSVCCDAQRVEFQLQQGANSITFANPDGEAPAIDKITVAAA